ncbi:MAG: hypothetical protein WA324_11290 [Bryobacteraceae bacterium]
MTGVLATLDVFRHDNGERRRLDLVDGLTREHLECVEREWKPLLEAARDRATLAFATVPGKKRSEDVWQEKQRIYGAPDAHWDWAEKWRHMGSMHRMLVLADGDIVEAIMWLDISKPSRLETASYTPIVYIENLAVGPWNRSPLQSPPRFKGLGKLMLGVAVAVSNSEGMNGRCGLHSLIQSEGFYRRAGMQELGLSPAERMTYFEFSPDGAKKFLES